MYLFVGHEKIFLYINMMSLCATKITEKDQEILVDNNLLDILVEHFVIGHVTSDDVQLKDMGSVLFKTLAMQIA